MKLAIACVLVSTTLLPAQPATFEAASIKLSNSARQGGGLNIQPARLKVINSTLKFCVQMAWNVKDFQVSGATGWMDTEHYDIDAVAAAPFEKDQYRAMLQALLVERFGLEIHRETQDKQGYALVVAKNGPKLPPPIEDRSMMFGRTPTGDMTFKATSVSMPSFADALSSRVESIVVDKTGIEGRYNVSFQWTPDASARPMLSKSGEPAPPPPADAVPGPSIFTALQEKLGLKLETRKVPVEVIFIDRASKPTEN